MLATACQQSSDGHTSRLVGTSDPAYPSMGIETAFGQLDDLVVLLSEIDGIRGSLTDEEQSAVTRAVSKRRREFAAGRILARDGLRALGVQPGSIPVSDGRYPVWPDGIVGSISHTDDHVGVALANSSDYAAIGLDLVVPRSVTPDLFRSILIEAERSQLSKDSPTDAATLIFSCKESVYKAVNPIVDEFLDFLDVRIELLDGKFQAHCKDEKRSATLIGKGKGYLDIHDGLVRSLFLIR